MKSNKTLLLALSLPLVSTVSLNGSMLNGGLSDKAAVNTATDTSEKAILNAIMINPTTADILFSDNTRLSIDFYGENIFRFFKDNSGGIIRKPEAKPDADILVDSPREKVSGVTLTENDEEIAVSTSKVRVSFDKRTSLFKLIRLSDNYVVAEAASPLEFSSRNVSIFLKERKDEYFYGGGVQNGRFSHKGKIIAIQKELPCAPEYKTFVPGTSSDLNVYDAVYYAGDCNAGSKTIAINLPNDDRVHALKGTRRLQLRNAMKAKFDKILMPIGELILTHEQQKYLNFDAFFWNVTFHEVAHGLGVKQTINGKGSVDSVMGTEKTSWEEAKADILGLFMVAKLVEMGEITNISTEDAIATYIAGILRSVRFGAASSHGKANMMCFNYMEKAGAFSRDAKGQYVIDFSKAKDAMNSWAALILKTQGDGDIEFATKFRTENGGITPALQADLDRINGAGIPRDIRFIQGEEVLFGKFD